MLRQGWSGNEFANNVRTNFVLPDFIDGHNSRVPQLGRGTSFLQQPGTSILIVQQLGTGHLDGHVTTQGSIPGSIHGSKPATPNLLQQFITPESSRQEQ